MEEDQPRYLVGRDVPRSADRGSSTSATGTAQQRSAAAAAGREAGSARRTLVGVPPQETPWGIDMVQATDPLFGATYDMRTNAGKPICIIDSGIDRTHPDLNYDVDYIRESCARQRPVHARRMRPRQVHGLTYCLPACNSCNRPICFQAAAPLGQGRDPAHGQRPSPEPCVPAPPESTWQAHVARTAMRKHLQL